MFVLATYMYIMAFLYTEVLNDYTSFTYTISSLRGGFEYTSYMHIYLTIY